MLRGKHKTMDKKGGKIKCYYCGKEIKKGEEIPIRIAESPKDYLGGGMQTFWHKECAEKGLSREWLEENADLFEK